MRRPGTQELRDGTMRQAGHTARKLGWSGPTDDAPVGCVPRQRGEGAGTRQQGKPMRGQGTDAMVGFGCPLGFPYWYMGARAGDSAPRGGGNGQRLVLPHETRFFICLPSERI